MAKRLSRVIPSLIGETQSAFVKDRQILDGVLIANEVVWWAKKTKQKAVILKLDFQKAYDTVRWDFLEEIMLGMGFGNRWTNWVMECVKTASMSILVNGAPTAPFCLQRGLRQGDPLSHFLFLLVAESFNRIVCRGRELGVLEGIKVGKDRVPVTHLQFADDTIIFAPADIGILDAYKKLIRCFALLTGLKINYQKSVLIPMECEPEWVVEAVTCLECGISNLPVTYLGIPLGANPRKVKTWDPIIEKVERRLALWKARCLSKAGRLVLIKSVLNNLPMYYLSLYRMPKKVAGRIIQIQRRFFWGKKEGEKGGNLFAWDLIQKPVEHGGLGVGDLSIRNAALLFKWWWRFADEQKPLWKEIVKSNHNTRHIDDFQNMKENNQGSIWGQIVSTNGLKNETQEVMRKGIRMRVGNGAQTRFWLDCWVGDECLKTLYPRLFTVSSQKEHHIREMGTWVSGDWKWRLSWRRKLFAWEEDILEDLLLVVNHIVLRENTRDVRIWSLDKSCLFSVSNFVLQVNHVLYSENSHHNEGRLAWRNLAPPRAQLLLWFILQGRLNTKDRLSRIGVSGIGDDRCVLCKMEPETMEHVLFSCRVSSSLWYHCCNRWNIDMSLHREPVVCFLAWKGCPFRKFDKKLWIAMFYVITWTVWDIRNKITFQEFQPKWEFEKKRLFWRLGTWTRGWCPQFPFSPEQMNDEWNEVRVWREPKNQRRDKNSCREIDNKSETKKMTER